MIVKKKLIFVKLVFNFFDRLLESIKKKKKEFNVIHFDLSKII